MNRIINFGRSMKRQINSFINYNKKKVKLGFIGCGRHAKINLYPALKYTDANLFSVCAKHLYSAANTAEVFGAKNYYTDYRLMIKEEKLEGVIICVNRKLHHNLIKDAINNNLHVFVEKPPVSTTKELNELAELSKMKKKQILVGYQKRFSTVYKKMKDVILNNELGKIISYKSEFCVGKQFSIEELLYEIGIHHIDLAQYLMGPIKSINYKTKNSFPFSINLIFNFKNNVIGNLLISSSRKGKESVERVEIVGEYNSVIAENMSKLKMGNNIVWELNPVVPNLENNTLYTNGYIPELRHFIKAIKKNKKTLNSIEESRKTIDIIEKIMENK